MATLLALTCALSTLSAQAPAQPPVFRVSRDVVSLDVIVRDRAGNVVRDLTEADFEVREEGRAQELLTVTFQEVTGSATAAGEVRLLQRLGLPSPASPAQASATSDLSGRRLVMLLFDLSAMEPEEVERGVRAALRYVDTQMSDTDLVAIASLTWQLTVLSDFTADRDTVRRVLQGLAPVDVRTGDPSASTPTEAQPDAEPGGAAVVATDARLRALRLLAEALSPVAQKKALLYFTAGLGNGAQDTPAELRAATTAASRANLAIYPVDTRGLQAVIPNGPARIASRGGEGLFSGSDLNEQFGELTASQDMLASMASSTGGRLFSGANDVSEAFTRMQRDTAAYYLLGYSSSNTTRDGRFRRVQVRVRRDGLRVESRAGYYAERDFDSLNRIEREAQLEEYLTAPAGSSTLTLAASPGPFLGAPGGLTVPFTIANAGIPAFADRDVQVDVLAVVQDEQGRSVARLRDTATVRKTAPEAPPGLIYTSAVVLPPGRFTLTAVMRENLSGQIGQAQVQVLVPLSDEGFEIQGMVLSSGTLAVDAMVFDSLATAGTPRSYIVGLQIFRNGITVMDVEMREKSRTTYVLGTIVELELPSGLGTLTSGSYTCQMTAVDPTTGRFSFTRSSLEVP
ncbi:MAG: VWA domain-containing protein [Vicinamibacterales bacterium]